jgi:hypothetical protein
MRKLHQSSNKPQYGQFVPRLNCRVDRAMPAVFTVMSHNTFQEL